MYKTKEFSSDATFLEILLIIIDFRFKYCRIRGSLKRDVLCCNALVECSKNEMGRNLNCWVPWL